MTEALEIIQKHKHISKTEMSMASWSDEAIISELVSIINDLDEEIMDMHIDAAGASA